MNRKEERFVSAAYNFAFLDQGSKREIRRKTLKAVAIPGYQVPFASRDLPIAKGWGTGGIQLTLSHLDRSDIIKVIDQGCDDSVNAVNIRRLIAATSGIGLTEDTAHATLIQSRHRIPDERLDEDQILILQSPIPDPLRRVEPREEAARRLHATKDYSAVWLSLYEQVIRSGGVTIPYDYPVMVQNRYLMAPTPIPRWDTPKLHQAEHLTLFGAGREKNIYAIPPFTDVLPIQFDDYPFELERQEGRCCRLCGSTTAYLESTAAADGKRVYQCSDTAYCRKRQEGQPVKGWYAK